MKGAKQIVVFKLGDTDYGFPIEHVNEIIRYFPTTEMPDSPAYMEGVCDIRGKIHVILNLNSILGTDSKTNHEKSYIIIANNFDAGFIVDEVKMIVSPGEESIIDTSSLPKYIDNNYILYIIKCDEKLVNVLNLHSILSRSMNNGMGYS